MSTRAHRAFLPILPLLLGHLCACGEDDGPTAPNGSDPPATGFVQISAGTFVMGAASDEPGSTPDERPQHRVRLRQAIDMQATEVTNQQYLDLAQWAVSSGYAKVDETGL